jgi:hypothetical protein
MLYSQSACYRAKLQRHKNACVTGLFVLVDHAMRRFVAGAPARLSSWPLKHLSMVRVFVFGRLHNGAQGGIDSPVAAPMSQGFVVVAIRLGLGSRAVSISLEGHDILVRSRHDGDDDSNARIKLTSALSPPFVNARVRFLAPLPGEGGIVGIPFGAAAVVGGRIVRI